MPSPTGICSGDTAWSSPLLRELHGWSLCAARVIIIVITTFVKVLSIVKEEVKILKVKKILIRNPQLFCLPAYCCLLWYVPHRKGCVHTDKRWPRFHSWYTVASGKGDFSSWKINIWTNYQPTKPVHLSMTPLLALFGLQSKIQKLEPELRPSGLCFGFKTYTLP